MLLKLASLRAEISGVSSFIWEKPPGFTFYPGQYLDYKLPVKDPNGDTRAFTISTSPTEKTLMLTTREGRSIFKKKLFTLKPGETIESSHPAGTFILDETSPAIFIAGGIGITPFRSMIKYAADKKLTNLMTLIYSNSDDDFPFKKELVIWQKQLHSLTIKWIDTSKQGLLDKNKLASLTTNYSLPATIFYLAGPPKMVDSFEKMLLKMGIDKTNIRYDRFDGY